VKRTDEPRAYGDLANLVTTTRLELTLSQADLATRLGTSVSAVSRLESGQHRPNLETLERLGRAFGRIVVVGFEDVTGRRELVTLDDRDAHPTWESVPGYDLVSTGLLDLKEGRGSADAALVRSASRRLTALGFVVPAWPTSSPPYDLYSLVVAQVGEGRAHGRYNALRRRLASFLRSARLVDAPAS